MFQRLTLMVFCLMVVALYVFLWLDYRQGARIRALEFQVRDIQTKGVQEKEWDVFLLQVFNNEGPTTLTITEMLEFKFSEGAESEYPYRNVFNIPANGRATIAFTALDTLDFNSIKIQGGDTYSVTRITV